MKGQRISELLNEIDDDLLSDALPPAWKNGQGQGRQGKPGRKQRRILPTLGRIWNSGWTAAVLSVVVSAIVLAAIIRAGQNAAPPTDVDPLPTPGTRPSEEMRGTEPVYDGTSAESESREPAVEDVVSWWEAPVVLLVDGCEVHGLYEGYLVYESFNGHSDSYEADGGGAVPMLPEIGDSLMNDQFVCPKGSQTFSFATGDSTMTVTGIAVYDSSYRLITTVSGDSVDIDLLREAKQNGFFLIVQVEVNETTDTYEKHGLYEYPVYVFITPVDPFGGDDWGNTFFASLSIEGYPSASIAFSADAVEKALYGDMDIDPASEDMAEFAELYGSGASPEDVSAMIRLIRSVPVPGFKGNPPSYVSYSAGTRKIFFHFVEGGLRYHVELFLLLKEAKASIRSYKRFPNPIVISDHLHLLAVISIQSDDYWHLWMTLDGVPALVSVWSEDTSLAGQSIPAVLDRIGVTRPAGG